MVAQGKRVTPSSPPQGRATILIVFLPLMTGLAILPPSKRPYAVAALLGAAIPIWLLARVSPVLRYYLRVVAFVGCLGVSATWGVITSALLALVGRREDANYVVARSFYHLAGPLTGIKFRIEGTENLPNHGEAAVIVGNHQSMVDILYLGAFFPRACSIMAKKELRWAPLLGQFMWLSNAVFVDRADRKSALTQFKAVGETMKRKSVSLFIFVEGTRTLLRQPALLPLKKGAFHLAVEGQVPIVPVVCENYWKRYSSIEKRFEPGEIVIRVLPAISSEGLTSDSADIAKLSDKTRNAMLDALSDLAKRPNSASGSTDVERDGKKVLEAKKAKRTTTS